MKSFKVFVYVSLLLVVPVAVTLFLVVTPITTVKSTQTATLTIKAATYTPTTTKTATVTTIATITNTPTITKTPTLTTDPNAYQLKKLDLGAICFPNNPNCTGYGKIENDWMIKSERGTLVVRSPKSNEDASILIDIAYYPNGNTTEPLERTVTVDGGTLINFTFTEARTSKKCEANGWYCVTLLYSPLDNTFIDRFTDSLNGVDTSFTLAYIAWVGVSKSNITLIGFNDKYGAYTIPDWDINWCHGDGWHMAPKQYKTVYGKPLIPKKCPMVRMDDVR